MKKSTSIIGALCGIVILTDCSTNFTSKEMSPSVRSLAFFKSS